VRQDCQQLIECLDQLVTVYRHLLDLVRKEQQILTETKLDELTELNKSKEKMVLKIKQLEMRWMTRADALGKMLQLKSQPSLKEIAEKVGGEQGLKLHNQRSVLNMLVSRVQEYNKKNEALVQAALAHIAGAMNAIAETFKPNKTYKSGGEIRGDRDGASGRLITKQV